MLGGEFMLIDDNNDHNGEGLKYAVYKKSLDGKRWLVCEVDKGFHPEDKLLQGLIDTFVNDGPISYINDYNDYNSTPVAD